MEKFKTVFRQTLFNPNFYYSILVGFIWFGSIWPNTKVTEKNYLAQPVQAMIADPIRMDHPSPLEKFYIFDPFFQNKTINTASLGNNQLYRNNTNSKSLMESLCHFSKQYQISSVVNAIKESGFESKYSLTNLNQTSVLNFDTQNITNSQNNFKLNSSNKINNKTSNYNALLSFGTGIEINHYLIRVYSTELKEKIREILTTNLTQLKAVEINTQLLPFFVEMQNKLVNLLRPAMEKYHLNDITFTDFQALPYNANLSGITFVTNQGRNVVTNRARLESLFQFSNAQEYYFSCQTLIDSLQNVREVLIQFSESRIDLEAFRQIIEGTLTSVENVNLDLTVSHETTPIIKHTLVKEISPLNLQIYSKPFHGVSASFGFNLQNKDLSIGLGQAKFFPYKNSKFGITTGADVSANFNVQKNFNYVGLKGKLFIGLGYMI